MTNIEIRINGAAAVKGKQDGLLTAGMVGATVRFSFDSLWDGLSKTAVFKCGGMVRDVIGVEDTARIPTEVLCADTELYVGVEGRSGDGAVVIPTVWVRAAYVYPGANASGDSSTDPTLPVWAQIKAMIGDLAKLHTADKSSLVAAINEALRSGGGAVDEETIARLVDEYLAAHPVQGKPGEDGGYYTPNVMQSADGEATIGWEASREGMPEVAEITLTLPAGQSGKSAYAYAQDAGYAGTEAEFAQKLATEAPTGGSGWKKLIDYTTTEDIFGGTEIPSITFTEDMEGNPLQATNLFVKISGTMTNGTIIRMMPNNTYNAGFAEIQVGNSAGQYGIFSCFLLATGQHWRIWGVNGKTFYAHQGRGYQQCPQYIGDIAFGGTKYTLQAGARFEVWEVCE